MINDELKKIWKSSSQKERVKFEKSRLILELQSNIKTIDKKIKSRDLRETMAALIVIPVFLYYAFTIPFLITKIASVLIVIWAAYVVVRLHQTTSYKPSEYHESYLTYLVKSKEYLQKQKELSDNVLWWYIAPFLFLIILFLIGFAGDSEKVTWIVMTSTAGVLLSIVILFMNKKYSEKEYGSRINKIDELIRIINQAEE